MMTTLREDLVELINKHSREIESNTPDFILADVMCDALIAYERGVRARDTWYGISPAPGQSNLPDGPVEIPPAAETKTEVESAPTVPAPIATPLPIVLPEIPPTPETLVPFIDPNPSLNDDDHDCEDGMVDDDPGVPF